MCVCPIIKWKSQCILSPRLRSFFSLNLRFSLFLLLFLCSLLFGSSKFLQTTFNLDSFDSTRRMEYSRLAQQWHRKVWLYIFCSLPSFIFALASSPCVVKPMAFLRMKIKMNLLKYENGWEIDTIFIEIACKYQYWNGNGNRFRGKIIKWSLFSTRTQIFEPFEIIKKKKNPNKNFYE